MKSITVRQISNGFIVTTSGGPPASSPGANEKFVATIEELTDLLRMTFV
jgi:hypothetical protein